VGLSLSTNFPLIRNKGYNTPDKIFVPHFIMNLLRKATAAGATLQRSE
jgi:hypothetical protein